GQKKTAEVGADEKWRVDLDAMSATAEPHELRIRSTKDDAVKSFSDVVVGEVWICSGQSNMQMPATAGTPGLKDLMAKAENIRSFEVEKTVAFSEQEACRGEWKTTYPNSAVAMAFSYFLEEAAEVPVGIILTSWGSSSIEGWMSRDMTEELPHFRSIMEKFDADEKLHGEIKTILAKGAARERAEDIKLRTQPNIIFNAMMKPLAPYACRGVVWYQGEANAKTPDSMQQYGVTLKLWMKRYREEWGREDLHFLVAMLPGYTNVPRPKSDGEVPTLRSWAYMREAQLTALALPGTGVANTIDLGDKKNIHPTDKVPVGQRLALLAQRDTLGMDIVAEGPVMKTAEAKGGEIIVSFDQSEGLTTKDGEAPKAFWVADDSKKWVRAKAEIAGQTVVLKSEEVMKPLYVRYAFSAMPEVNLVNGAGLPARPFRTDEFEP
ncbi:MAG: sialate O-acetylesterase, partial [Luteolibacter sp.]